MRVYCVTMPDEAREPLPLPPVTPYLTVPDAAAAIAFYERAFGAVERERNLTPDGRKIMHAEIELNGGVVMLSDDFAGTPQEGSTPGALGGSPVTIHLQADDGAADALWERAVAAGAEVTMPFERQFWGAAYGRLRDPFGHHWALIARMEPVSDEELREGAARAMPDHAGE